MNRRLLAVPALALLPLLPVLAACGGSGTPDTAPVASLTLTPSPTVATSADAPSAPAAGADSAGDSDSDGGDTSGRPQMRLDDTEARRTTLINAWDQCLLDHGAQQDTRRAQAAAAVPAGADGVPFIQIVEPIPASAKAACQSKLPLLPPETDASTNPHFHEQSLAYVGCLKDHGLWVTLLNSHDLDWTYTDGHPVPDDNAQIEQSCLLKAFS